MSIDPKLSRAVAERVARVLIINPQAPAARMLATQLRDLAPSEATIIADTTTALKAVNDLNPTLIFVEHTPGETDGLEFTRRLRRSMTPPRGTPVILTTAEATAAVLFGARDAGVHEFLRKPFNLGDLAKRVVAVIAPRPWIQAEQYVGPDRRRFNSGDYKGPPKRLSDKRARDAVAVQKAVLALLRNADAALDVSPEEVISALKARADTLYPAFEPVPGGGPLAVELTALLELPVNTSSAARGQLREKIRALLALVPPS
ncbi:MAG: response regulator [Caulobacter sp.]